MGERDLVYDIWIKTRQIRDNQITGVDLAKYPVIKPISRWIINWGRNLHVASVFRSRHVRPYIIPNQLVSSLIVWTDNKNLQLLHIKPSITKKIMDINPTITPYIASRENENAAFQKPNCPSIGATSIE